MLPDSLVQDRYEEKRERNKEQGEEEEKSRGAPYMCMSSNCMNFSVKKKKGEG